jgi:hypothetical protein
MMFFEKNSDSLSLIYSSNQPSSPTLSLRASTPTKGLTQHELNEKGVNAAIPIPLLT